MPGAPAAALAAGEATIGSGIAFGEVGGYKSVKAGRAELELRGEDDKALAKANATLEDGSRYTAVALGSARKPEVRIYRDGSARRGAARLRVIHAAPELGSPDVTAGDEQVASGLGFREASPYRSVTPGNATVSATRKGADEPLVSRQDVALTAGTATTAVLAGTAGERAEVVVLTDASSAPRRGPDTGLGGLSDEGSSRLLLALLAAALAGALGGGAYRVATSRGSRRS